MMRKRRSGILAMVIGLLLLTSAGMPMAEGQPLSQVTPDGPVVWVDHIISEGLASPQRVWASDIDGDGDVDIIGSASNSGVIVWWENGGSGSFTQQHLVGDFYRVMSVRAADFDSDGEVDVLATSLDRGEVAWWKNDGEQNFAKHLIDDSFSGAMHAIAEDIDGDGHMDVVGASMWGSQVAWWENLSEQPGGVPTFAKHIIAPYLDHAYYVDAQDVDGDGYMDVLGAACLGNEIAWWKNDGYQNFAKHVIADNYICGTSVEAVDIDQDGYVDVLGTSGNEGDRIAWWRNDGEQNFMEYPIYDGFDDPYEAWAVDVDGDDDIDVVVSGQGADEIAWWENNGYQNFAKHTVATDFDNARGVYAFDIDGDEDVDIVAAATLSNEFVWWENTPANQPPTVDAGGPYSVEEGTAIPLDGATASDPDSDPLSIAWSMDEAGTCTFDDTSALNPNLTCRDDGAYQVTLTVSDGQDTASDSATVTVNNVAPMIDAITAPIEPVNINDQPVSVVVGFSDPGTADTHDITWEWGDTSSDTQYNGTSPASQHHTYAEAGVFAVQLTVTDDDGDSNTEPYEFVVIYDPDGGFVTGGGWLNSPEGAYKPNPTLTGKANFGFVSKYKKGATVPTGNTEFNFKAGDLNFHSSSYQWLVVTGSNYAKFKGSGTINGMGDYKFQLWAGDGQPDTFRIKIWYEDGGEVLIYDNGFDQAIGGGSIKVHDGEQ